MAVKLSTATERRERAEQSKRERDAREHQRVGIDHYLSATELAREIASAVRAEPAARALSDAERDALSQELAWEVLTRAEDRRAVRRGSPRDVLRWIARADLLSAGQDVTLVERGDVGRNYLRTRARALLSAEGSAGRGWRDVAATWQERERSDRAQVRAARVEMWSLDYLTEHGTERPDLLTRAALGALSRAGERDEQAADVVAPLALAQAVGTVLTRDVGDLLSERDRRCLSTALRVAAGEQAAVVAARTGRSLKAVRKDTEHGRDLLRESAADVRAAVAHVGDVLDRAARPDVLRLSAAERAAGEAVERVGLSAKHAPTQPSANRGHVDGGCSALPLRRFRVKGATCPA